MKRPHFAYFTLQRTPYSAVEIAVLRHDVGGVESHLVGSYGAVTVGRRNLVAARVARTVIIDDIGLCRLRNDGLLVVRIVGPLVGTVYSRRDIIKRQRVSRPMRHTLAGIEADGEVAHVSAAFQIGEIGLVNIGFVLPVSGLLAPLAVVPSRFGISALGERKPADRSIGKTTSMVAVRSCSTSLRSR